MDEPETSFKVYMLYSEAVAGKSAQSNKWDTCRTEQHVRTEFNGKRYEQLNCV